jgi:hypothetical protein
VPFSVTYHADVHVVETVYAGILSREEFNEAVAATGDAAGEHLCGRFLSDCRRLDASGRGATLDIWQLAEFLAMLPPGTFEREAIVLPAAAASADVVFYETTCRNRGLAVRLFDDREAALGWLRG